MKSSFSRPPIRRLAERTRGGGRGLRMDHRCPGYDVGLDRSISPTATTRELRRDDAVPRLECEGRPQPPGRVREDAPRRTGARLSRQVAELRAQPDRRVQRGLRAGQPRSIGSRGARRTPCRVRPIDRRTACARRRRVGEGRLEPGGGASVPSVPRDPRRRQLDPSPGHPRRLVATRGRPRARRRDRRQPIRVGPAVHHRKASEVAGRDTGAAQLERAARAVGVDRRGGRTSAGA